MEKMTTSEQLQTVGGGIVMREIQPSPVAAPNGIVMRELAPTGG